MHTLMFAPRSLIPVRLLSREVSLVNCRSTLRDRAMAMKSTPTFGNIFNILVAAPSSHQRPGSTAISIWQHHPAAASSKAHTAINISGPAPAPKLQNAHGHGHLETAPCSGTLQQHPPAAQTSKDTPAPLPILEVRTPIALAILEKNATFRCCCPTRA